jgi:hypothetical protein
MFGRSVRVGAKGLVAAAIVLAVVAWLPIPASAALLKSVTSGTVNLPNNTTPTQVALTGVDITKAFVLCSERSFDSTASNMLYSCDLNNGGVAGAARLSITPVTAPGGATSFVQYYVAEFAAGVSVQRGTVTFTGTNLTPTAAPALTTVDCTKSFVLTSARTTLANATADEEWTVRATLGTAAAPCTTTTTNLELTRLEGVAGSTLTVAWQVVTYEGASVQRGTSCIGGAAAAPACPTAGGATNGLNNRITLGTGVDTTKSFILFTLQAGTAVAGVDGEFLVRGEFLATGAAVTTAQFVRSVTSTTSNHQVQISWEVVTLNDGSTVQSSGTTPTVLAAATASASPNLATLVDATRTVAIVSASGGAGTTTVFNDVVVTATIAASDGVNASEVVLTRTDTTVASTIAWFAVSFFRCSTASGLGHDTLCTVGASTTGTQATVGWTSTNTVIIARSVGSSATGTPTNGQTYCTSGCSAAVLPGAGGSAIVYPSVATPPSTDTSFAQSGLTTGTTYFYKVWAKNPTAVGACTAAPCYVTGTEVSVTPRSGANSWASIVSGGAALNPPVPTNAGGVSLGSNAGKLTTLSGTDGTWVSAPVSTSGVNQGYLTVADTAGGEAVIGADSAGFVYSANPSTGAINWLVKLNANAINAAPTLYARAWFSAAMTTTYPGAYDLLFFATNNTLATNNKIIALRSDTGAVVWTYAPTMDVVLGQPALDYTRDRLYWASRNNGGAQNSLWILNVAVNPATLVVSFSGAGADFTTAPTQSFDGDSLFVGDEAGKLHVVNLAASPPTRTTPYTGASAFRGFVWEDFNNWGRLYFITANGNVNSLATPASSTLAWSVQPVVAGTVSQIMPGESSLWAGGSNGTLYQLSLANGATQKTFVVGDGTKSVGPMSADSIDDVYTTTSDGRVYRILLTNQSLP